jgi:rhodanese-related sulfurtransferase
MQFSKLFTPSQNTLKNEEIDEEIIHRNYSTKGNLNGKENLLNAKDSFLSKREYFLSKDDNFRNKAEDLLNCKPFEESSEDEFKESKSENEKENPFIKDNEKEVLNEKVDLNQKEELSDDCNKRLFKRLKLNNPTRGSNVISRQDTLESLLSSKKHSQHSPLKSTQKTIQTQNSSHSANLAQCWSRKSFSLMKSNSLIKSAPLTFGSSVWDSENNGEIISLPVLGCGRSDSIKRISGTTLINLINGTIPYEFTIIDARFKYEYDGGHIDSAININAETEIFKLIPKNRIIIIHCELSSIRGPNLAKRLRNLDRSINEYPILKYPEIYILEGGYRNFYKSFTNFCTPQDYIQMYDTRFREECVSSHKKNK